jgi:Mg/Co/Ni transporter MgtE
LSQGEPIGRLAKRDVPVCELTETIAAVQKKVRGGTWESCVVVNTERIVLGVLQKNVWEEAGTDMPVEQLMEPGPSTFRPHLTRTEMTTYMEKKKMQTALVTTPDGKLLGLLRLQDLQ